METAITSNLDHAIRNYNALHGGNNPLYCIMSAEEADEITHSLKKRAGQADNEILTRYQDITIIRNEFMDRGEYFLSNELPETGS